MVTERPPIPAARLSSAMRGAIMVSRREEPMTTVPSGNSRFVCFATSLHPESRSRALLRHLEGRAADRGVSCTWVDLRDRSLPIAGCEGADAVEDVRELRDVTAAASHVVFGVPIYNYQVGSPAKHLVELLGREALEGKTVGLVCTAGGAASHMAPLPFLNGLMLDFRCWIAPRYVYALADEIDGADRTPTAAIARRIDGLVDDLLSRA